MSERLKVCYGSLTDIRERIRDVRFTPESGRPLLDSPLIAGCPFIRNSDTGTSRFNPFAEPLDSLHGTILCLLYPHLGDIKTEVLGRSRQDELRL